MSQTIASAFDNRVVTFVDISDKFDCVICLNVADDPVRSSLNCISIFCNGCMRQALAHRRHCPTCDEEIANETDIRKLRDSHIRKDIFNYAVYCINQTDDNIDHNSRKRKEDGKCTWIGKYDQLAAHLNQCDYEMVKCTNNGCAAKFERWMMMEHLQVCPHRMVNCGHCNVVVKAAAMLNHLRQCPKVDVSCECGFECSRDTLPAHQENDCLLAEISCDVIGCDAKMRRCDYEKHQDESAPQHVRLLKQQNIGLAAGFDILKCENARLLAGDAIQVVSITPNKQFKWRISEITSKLQEAIIDEKDYNSARFDLFFHGNHKLYIQAQLKGTRLGLFLWKDITLSEDKNRIGVSGSSFSLSAPDVLEYKLSLPAEMMMLGPIWSLGFRLFIRDITPYIDNNCINVQLDLELVDELFQ